MLLLVTHLCTLAYMQTPSVEYTGYQPVSSSTQDQNGATFTVTGLSGIAWSGGDQWVAVMDNSDKIVRFTIVVDADGEIDSSISGGLTVARYGDYEDIAVAADGTILLVDETTQDIHRFDPITGLLSDSYAMPKIYMTRRGNLGCESLWSDGNDVWIANEEALGVDGPVATPEEGTYVRLCHGDISKLVSTTQYAYLVDPMHGPYIPITGDGQSGLCALMELPSGQLLSLERSLAFQGALFESRMYVIDVTGATDVGNYPTLTNDTFTPAMKSQLYLGGHQNLEGIGLGPSISDLDYLVLGVVDDGDPLSNNRVLAFIIQDVESCHEDVTQDGVVGVADVLALIDFWGPCASCDEDLDQSGIVDVVDLLLVISNWGDCP